MKSINTSISSKLVALMAGAALFGLVSQSALALTPAGTEIINFAKLIYKVGGVDQNDICSSPAGNGTSNGGVAGASPACADGVNGAGKTSFLVDYKVNLTVSGGTPYNVTPGQLAATPALTTGAYTTFVVTNLSNTPQDFALTAADAAIATAFVAPATSNDAFDSTGVTIYVGATLATAVVATKITALAAGSGMNVYVSSAIPVTATNGQQSMISLQAQAIWPAVLPVWAPAATANGNTLAVAGAAIVATTAGAANNAGTTADIVFADNAGVLDIASDGKFSAYDAYTIASSALSVAKTVKVICDPINGNTNPKNIPGAYVQYAITIANTGSTAATLTTVTDTLQANALDVDLLLISGAGAVPLTACSAGGISNSASGFGAVYATGTTTTSYTLAGALPAQAVTAGYAVGSTVALGKTVTITYSALTGGTGLAGFASASLPANSYITVYFNAIVQ